MSIETFINSSVELGIILTGVRGRIDCFIKSDGPDYKEFCNFVNLTNDKKCLFDVGCADGVFSLAFCSDDKKVSHAFDGSHQLQLGFTETLVKNPTKRIYYHKMFLGEQDVIRQYNSTGLQSYATGGNDTIVMVKLDSFCALTDAMPDVIKIDTEGYEYNVLMGGLEYLKSYRPLMFVELHPRFTQMYGTTISQVFDVQKEANYTIKGLDGEEVTVEMVNELKADSMRTVWYPN
jgi:FkbM family methyltransferase